MGLALQELSATISSAAYGVVGVVAAAVILSKLLQWSKLAAIPTVGPSMWLGSCWTAVKYVTNAQSIIQEGYDKYKSAPFRIPEPYQWTVILCDQRSVEELARASEEDFSFLAAIDDQIHLRYILGDEIIDNPYHVEIIRSQLTRNLQTLYPEIRDEIVASFDEVLDLKGSEWKCMTALGAVQKVVCRTSNRLFVGLPLCRDPDWIDLNIHYSMNVIKGGATIGLFPSFMRTQATRLFTNAPQNIARAVRHLQPIIEERRKYLNEYGENWDDKPSDLLLWLMEQATEGPESTVTRVANRMLAVNFAVVYTTANFFTQVLLRLAANRHYIQPLREEVEDIVKNDGWSKTALGKMRRIDSFLRECHRIEGLNIVTVSRKALKDFTFSDATFIPKGTVVAVATTPLHHDSKLYENPDTFEPFRFVDTSEEDTDGLKYQFTSTSTEYLPFGHGRRACPGRFLAANELKSMLAHLVVTYDVKLEDGPKIPTSQSICTFVTPDPKAKVMFRNRVD